MEITKTRFAAAARDNARIIVWASIAVLFVICVIWICISNAQKTNIRGLYTQSRSAMGEALLSDAQLMILRYDDAALVGADIEGQILPAMREYFLRAQAVNSAIEDAYGAKYVVMSTSTIKALEGAFAAYDDARLTGKSTAPANEQMLLALNALRAELDMMYDENNNLVARK